MVQRESEGGRCSVLESVEGGEDVEVDDDRGQEGPARDLGLRQLDQIYFIYQDSDMSHTVLGLLCMYLLYLQSTDYKVFQVVGTSSHSISTNQVSTVIKPHTILYID